MNPNRHVENVIDCGRRKLSDSYTKLYSSTKLLSFVIIVFCKGRGIVVLLDQTEKQCVLLLERKWNWRRVIKGGDNMTATAWKDAM